MEATKTIIGMQTVFHTVLPPKLLSGWEKPGLGALQGTLQDSEPSLRVQKMALMTKTTWMGLASSNPAWPFLCCS